MLMELLFKPAYVCLESHQKALSEQALSRRQGTGWFVLETGPCTSGLFEALTYRYKLYGMCAYMLHEIKPVFQVNKQIGSSRQEQVS